MKLLFKGSKGNEVKKWQSFLNGLKKKKYNVGKIDGIFGGKTDFATRNFQEDNDLIVDGIVGKNTYLKAIKNGYNASEARINKAKRYINEIIVHITAAGNSSLEKIIAMHKRRGFSDIGYHFLILENGYIYEGRDINTMGAHCKAQGKNIDTIGIAYDSRGSDTDSNGEYGKYMTTKQKKSLEQLTAWLAKQYNLSIFDISGHNDYDYGKACPCFKVKKSQKFLNQVQKLLNRKTLNPKIISRK